MRYLCRFVRFTCVGVFISVVYHAVHVCACVPVNFVLYLVEIDFDTSPSLCLGVHPPSKFDPIQSSPQERHHRSFHSDLIYDFDGSEQQSQQKHSVLNDRGHLRYSRDYTCPPPQSTATTVAQPITSSGGGGVARAAGPTDYRRASFSSGDGVGSAMLGQRQHPSRVGGDTTSNEWWHLAAAAATAATDDHVIKTDCQEGLSAYTGAGHPVVVATATRRSIVGDSAGRRTSMDRIHSQSGVTSLAVSQSGSLSLLFLSMPRALSDSRCSSCFHIRYDRSPISTAVGERCSIGVVVCSLNQWLVQSCHTITVN